MIDFLAGYKWGGFIIAFILFVILPVWVLTFFPTVFFHKILMTLVLGVIVFIAVKSGGTKRGLIFKR